MDLATRTETVRTEFTLPLIAQGFRPVARQALSVVWTEGTAELAILRVLRSGVPYDLRLAICFRHRFLRPTQSDDPAAGPLGPSDYPWRLNFRDFLDYPKRSPCYAYRAGFQHDDLLRPGDFTPASLSAALQLRRDIVQHKVLDWARRRSPQAELAELRTRGTGLWCERRWIEDYQAYLARFA